MVLDKNDVQTRDVSQNWNDWAVKNVWHLVRHQGDLRMYLPAEEMDEGFHPDREFFWGVVFTQQPQWANEYYDRVIDKKRREVVENPNNKKII